jgi:DNA invertase Pin-like site-specific DNA recombinase
VKHSKTRKRPKIDAPADGTRLIGYARVSTEDQNLDMQLDALRNAGVLDDNLYFEAKSGVSDKRPQLAMCWHDARPGDTVVVWKLDRLGRNVVQLYLRVNELRVRGVGFRSLTEGFDLGTPMGNAMFGMMAVFAQFERDQIGARTAAGMKALRDRGGPQAGQPPKMPPKGDPKLEKQLGTMLVREVAALYDCEPQTVYSRYNSKELEALRIKYRRRKS